MEKLKKEMNSIQEEKRFDVALNDVLLWKFFFSFPFFFLFLFCPSLPHSLPFPSSLHFWHADLTGPPQMQFLLFNG